MAKKYLKVSFNLANSKKRSVTVKNVQSETSDENLTMAEANMLNKLSPVFVTICACIFLKEKVDKKQVKVYWAYLLLP